LQLIVNYQRFQEEGMGHERVHNCRDAANELSQLLKATPEKFTPTNLIDIMRFKTALQPEKIDDGGSIDSNRGNLIPGVSFSPRSRRKLARIELTTVRRYTERKGAWLSEDD
jgi:hypothetical protein